MSGAMSLRRPDEARLDRDVREILGGQRVAVALQARRGTARRRAGGHCPASRSASAPPARHCRSTAACMPGSSAKRVSRWRASAGMSPLRSRSGGMVTVVAEIRSARLGMEIVGQRTARRSRSGGRRPNWSRCSRPGGLRRSRARGRAFPGFPRGSAPTSSSSRVPPSASTIRPTRSAKAPGKGARHMAEQVAVDDVGGDRLAIDLNQRSAGAEAGRVDRAGEGFLAACRARRRSGSAAGCARPWRRRPARRENPARRRPVARAIRSGAIFSDSGASSPAARRRSAWAASASSSRSGATGLARKSDAPARIASTAWATDPPSASDDDRQVRRGNGEVRQSGPGRCRRPSCRQDRGLDLAAVRSLQQARRRFPSQAAPTMLQPARDGDRRELPPLIGVGIEQQ